MEILYIYFVIGSMKYINITNTIHLVIALVFVISLLYFFIKNTFYREGYSNINYNKRNSGVKKISKLLEIPSVYYINLDKRSDRKNKFIHDISKTIFKNNYHRFPAVDGQLINLDKYTMTYSGNIERKRGMIGCAESHLSIWGKCVSMNKNIIVFEDDPIFKSVYNKNIGLALKYTPPIFDIVYFHVNNKTEHKPYNKYYRKIIKNNYSLTNYMVSPRGAKRLIHDLSPYDPRKEIDVHIAEMTGQGKLEAFIFMLPTIYTVQDYTESNVQNSRRLVKVHDFHLASNTTV